MLNTVYGFLFEAGIPLNFSTIPAVNGAAKTLSHETKKETYEPFLPKHIAGEDRNYAISENISLTQTLRSITSNEFLLHGYEHSGQGGQCEFEARDSCQLEKKLNKGIEIFSDAFGKKPDTFVAPQDKYSFEAIELIKQYFNTLSLGWLDKLRLPMSCLPAYYGMKLRQKSHIKYGDLLLTEHPGCHYSRFHSREKCDPILDRYISNNLFTVIVTHHWEFFEDGILNLGMWHAFRSRIRRLRQDKNVRFIKFSELYDLI